MTVKAIVEWARAVPGYAGLAVYADGTEAFGENIGPEYAAVIRALLLSSPGAVRVSVAVRGLTFTAFAAGGFFVLLKVAGRFPALPRLSVQDVEFIGPSDAPGLPPIEVARLEAEAALRQFGLI